MIRIVLDINLLVSAILTPQGKPANILKLALEGVFSPVLSQAILKETRRVLRYPRLLKLMEKNRINFKDVDEFIARLSKIAVMTPGKLKVTAIQDDPPDNIILACAVEGEADFIISGDHHLRDLKTFEGIRVVDPETFLTIVKYEAPS